MTPSDRQAARAALGEARAIYIRLDQIRSPEDAAADVIELWTAVETAMRAMLGGSILSGQALISELAHRGTLTLDQANALVAFWNTRARLNEVSYKPTLTDVGHARVGYNALTQVVEETPVSKAAPQPHTTEPIVLGAHADDGEEVEEEDEDGSAYDAPDRRLSTPMIVAIVCAVALVIIVGTYFLLNNSSYDKQMATAIDFMRSGQVEAARAQFTHVAQQYPDQANPHVFLSRLSRNDGDMPAARAQLDTAIRLDPSNELALREMGILLLAAKNPDLARRFLVRAATLAPTDSSAQGYLGCALIQLKRYDEAQRFLSRAGEGSWSSCATIPAGAPRPSP